MAISFYPTISSGLPTRTGFAQSSLSCGSKVYAGLRVQSSNFRGLSSSNINVEFHNKVYRSIESRTCESKPTRGRVSMMPIGVPRVPYRNRAEGTWQWVDLWNALYRERVIFIGQTIDEEFSNQILATMLYLESIDDSRRLYMYINGNGGDLTPSMAIYDTMQSLRNPVCTHCVGYAYGLAAFLLAAGEKGYRTAMPLSKVGLEAPAGAVRGQADDVQNETEELIRIKNYLFKELSEKTGQPIEKIQKDLSRLKHFDSQEALEYGLIDRIVRPSDFKDDSERKDSTVGLVVAALVSAGNQSRSALVSAGLKGGTVAVPPLV
nr:ATP-dependent Clp protease proteolytic subunit-related protein 2, chloroplastic [Ipomoea batatas]